MKVHDVIEPRLRNWILAQPMFFVATAPLDGQGHVNVSPKGLDGCFAILDELRVAYQDFTGSGAETIAHLRENGRIVLMFCGFAGPPQIVRLHGRGIVHLRDEPAFAALAAAFPAPTPPAVRAIIEIAVERVSDSCGYSVPLMSYDGQRDLLERWAERKSPAELETYRRRKNATSIDGLTRRAGPLSQRRASFQAAGRANAARTILAASEIRKTTMP